MDKSEYALLCKLAYQCAASLSYLLLIALIIEFQNTKMVMAKTANSHLFSFFDPFLAANEADSKSQPILIDSRVNEPTGIFKINRFRI